MRNRSVGHTKKNIFKESLIKQQTASLARIFFPAASRATDFLVNPLFFTRRQLIARDEWKQWNGEGCCS
jgi:hypothetical protein